MLGSPSLTVCTVSTDVKQTLNEEASGTLLTRMEYKTRHSNLSVDSWLGLVLCSKSSIEIRENTAVGDPILCLAVCVFDCSEQGRHVWQLKFKTFFFFFFFFEHRCNNIDSGTSIGYEADKWEYLDIFYVFWQPLARRQCCFTRKETIRIIQGRGSQDGHLDFHTAPDLPTPDLPSPLRARTSQCT